MQLKVAAVIGGSGVLGGSMAEALAKAGASVAILYHNNRAGADKRVASIKTLGGKAIAVQADTSSRARLEEALKEIVAQWNHVDILVNAPGVNSPTPVFDIKDEEWGRILDTNLKGVFQACRVFAGHMLDRKIQGSIINISSASSEIPLSKVFTYSISKAGVNNMTRFLAREWATQGIRVNAIMPGFFPLNRIARFSPRSGRNRFLHTRRWPDSARLKNLLARSCGSLHRRPRRLSRGLSSPSTVDLPQRPFSRRVYES